MRVLIVEDDEPTSLALGEQLELEGHAVRCVRNGADAIDVLHTFAPDVLLVDLQLPVMDGRSFIELYRRRGATARVVVMSGRTDGRRVAESIGGVGYLAKPFEASDLLSAIAVAPATA